MMVEVPGVGAIVEQIKARIGQIEEQLRQQGPLTDELERLRDALGRLEGGVSARVRGKRIAGEAAQRETAAARKPGATRKPAAAEKPAAGRKPAAARRPAGAKKRATGKGAAASGKPRRAASSARRGEARAKILEALKDGSKTAGEIAAATGVNRGTASTTLSKLTKTGEVIKAERGYTLPEVA